MKVRLQNMKKRESILKTLKRSNTKIGKASIVIITLDYAMGLMKNDSQSSLLKVLIHFHNFM